MMCCVKSGLTFPDSVPCSNLISYCNILPIAFDTLVYSNRRVPVASVAKFCIISIMITCSIVQVYFNLLIHEKYMYTVHDDVIVYRQGLHTMYERILYIDPQ